MEATKTMGVFDAMIEKGVRNFNLADHRIEGPVKRNGRKLSGGVIRIKIRTTIVEGRIIGIRSQIYFCDRRIPRDYARLIGICAETQPNLLGQHDRCGHAVLPHPWRGSTGIRLVFLSERKVYG